MKKQQIFLLLISFLLICKAYGQTTYYSIGNGSWKDPNTWSTDSHTGSAASNAPGEIAIDDIVIIAAGHVVDYNADDDNTNAATISALTIGSPDGNGYLRFPFSNQGGNDDNELAGDYDLIVTGDVNIATNGYLLAVQGGETNPAGNTMPGTATDRNGHDIFIGGNLSNTGTIDLQNDLNTDYEVEIEFNGITNQTISGEGIWDTYNITYNNAGTSPANQIENQSVAFTTSVEAGRSTFTQGTYVHNNSGTYNNQGTNNDGNDYTDVSFEVQAGVFNMANPTTGDPTVILTNGSITVSGGRFNGGNNGIGSGEAINLQVVGNIHVSGPGILNIGDGDPGTSTTPTDGTLTVGGSASSVNSATIYSYDLTLDAGASLDIVNGAVVSVGNSNTHGGDFILDGATSNGSTVSISGVSTLLTVYSQLFVREDCSFTQNAGTVDITPTFTTGGDPESVQLEGENASYTMLAGTLNVMTSITEPTTNIDAIILEANNASVDIQGGTVNMGNPTSGRGRFRFRHAAGETAAFAASGSAVVNVTDAIQRNTAGAITNITLSDNAQLLVGTDNTSGNVGNSVHEGTLTINDNAIARFGLGGDLDNVTINGSGTLETGTTNTENKFDINGTFNYGSTTATCTFYQGMDIEAGASLNISAGTIDILADATTADDTRFQIRGDLTMNGGTINLGASIIDITNGNLLQVFDGGNLTINAGTFSMLANPALTSIANRNPFNITNDDAGEDATRGDGTVTIGDGSGGANSAQLIIAPNLAAVLPTPPERFLFDMDGINSRLTINSDGYLSVGGGNIGDLRLNTNGAVFQMNAGTCDIIASLRLDNGTQVVIDGGTLNIGNSASNGNNRVWFSAGNPTAITNITLNAGTINVGDGNSLLQIGNDNENPTFGDAAYSILEITGGTLNLNGAFNLDDANARFIMSNGNFNLNPQGDQNLDSDISIFNLEQGIADVTGGTITIVNPHATSGSGYAVNINGVGGAGNGNDEVSGIANLPSDDSPITFGNTFRFGDGSASLDGSVDGFDLNLSPDHTYGSLLVNNPDGANRQVELISAGNDYLMGGNMILFAGTFDINDNTINRNAVGGTLTINPTGRLIIGNSNGAHHFPGNATAFGSYTLNVGSTVEYDGAGNANVELPGSASFSNLAISGSGTKTLNTAETVNSTLTLEAGTFATGINLTMSAASTVLRTDGVMTGTIQGANAYTVAYEGTTKNTQVPEWSGSGDKSFLVNLDASETLTMHDNLTAQGSLTLSEGILADAGFTLTVGGDVSNSSVHSGAGRVLLTGSTTQRSIGGDGNGEFGNLELDDTNGAVFSGAQTVNGVLTLTDGVLDIDNFLLTLPTTASVSAPSPSATTMIQVNDGVGAAGVRKDYQGSGTESFTWPIGANGKYTPATVEVINATSGGTITVNPVDTENPFTTDASDVALDYYWIVSKSGFGFETANLSFTYDQTDADGRGNEAGYVPARYAPTSWTNINNVALVDESTNTISFNNVTYIEGQFTAAEPSEFGVVLTYYSRADGDWNTASSWSTVGLGGAAASTIPGSSTPVIIGNSNTINVSSDNTTAPSVEIQASGTLQIGDATTGHNFGTVAGAGTLSIVTNDTDATEFPGGTYTDLLSTSGGTVEYTGTGSYTVLDAPAAFNNLNISGSGTVTLPDADLSTNDNLSVGGSATVLVSNTVNGNLNIGDSLDIGAGSNLRLLAGTDRTITVGTNIINAGTFHTDGGGVSNHSVSIGGSLVNEGTFDMANTANHYANVTFTGASAASVSGSGATTEFYRLILNKGTDASSELDITATDFALAAPTNTTEKALEVQNGTFRLSAAHTITLSTGGGGFSIPATGGLWINNAGAVAEITSASSDLSLAGLLRITDGAINIGDDLTGVDQNSIFYTTGGATITVEGGTLTVGGAIRPNPDAATLAYSQSGGTVTFANNKSSSENLNNNSEADFCIETGDGSSFTMSDGLLEIARRNSTADGKAIRINEGISHSVTGGTVRILNANTFTNYDVGITSAAPFWNLEIGEGNSFTERVGATRGGQQDLTVLNDLTVNIVGGTFKLFGANRTNPADNEIDLNLGGNLTLVNGTFEAGEPSTVTFNGSGLSGQTSPQVVDGSLTFHSVTINNTSGGVQLSNDIDVNGDWTYTTGTFDQNTYSVNFNGTTDQTIGGNPLSFDDVEVNKATGGVILNTSQMTVSSDLSLTNGILNLGGNLLVLSEVTTISGSFDASTMIQTNGLTSGLGVQKAYSAAGGSFTFPIGTNVYSPATINVTDADGASGTITVNPVNSRDATAPETTSLDYQWVVATTGFGVNVGISHSYVYNGVDVIGTETSYYDAYFDGNSWVEGTLDVSNVNEADSTINLATTGSINDYQFTAGYDFEPPVTFYSLGNGNWETSTNWETSSDGVSFSPTDSLPKLTNPVIVRSGDTVAVSIINPDSVVAASITIESTGVLDIQETDGTQYTIGTVGGTGTLRFTVGETPDVPTLDNDFVRAGGGTIEYAYTANRALPTSQVVYNDLTLSGTNRYNLDTDYTVNGNLSVTTTDRLDDDGFSIIGTPSGTFFLDNVSELRVEGANSFPSGFGTYDMQSGSLVRYNSGNDQTVASLNGASYWDLLFSGASTKTLAGDITVADDLTINSRSVLSASTFSINIQGDWNRDSRNGSAFLPGTGSVIFNGVATQEIDITQESSAETFGNIEVNNSTGVTMDAGDAVQVTQLNVTGNLTFTTGTLDLDNRPLVVSGNMINNSGSTTPVTNASTVTFDNASVNQEINGDTGIDFETVSLTKAAGTTLTLNLPVSISGTLDMQNDGNIVLSGTTNDLTFGSAATISGSFGSSRMVVTDGTTSGSQVIKEGDATADTYDFTFPIGVGSSYTPVTLDATGVTTTGGSIGVQSVNGVGNYTLVDASRALNRHFVLDLNTITDITGSLSFTYADADVQGSEINYLSWVYDGSTLDEAASEFVTPGTNTFGSTNITISNATTEWTAGEAGAFFTRLYSQRNGVWSNGTNVWNTAADGSGIFTTPTRFNEVEIQNDHTITTDADDQDAAALIINGTLEVDGTTNHDFGAISGTDTLVLYEGALPGFNVLGTTFFENGTVEFTDGGGGSGYDLPTDILSYNNLVISGSQNKRLGGNITVTNDLTIDNATLDAGNSTNYNISLGGNLSLLNLGTLDPRDGTFALVGATAQTVPTGIAFNNLQFDNVGTKSITSTGTFDANDFRILSASGLVDFSVGTDVEITGDWSNGSGSGAAVYNNVQDLTLSGNANQSISGTNVFHNLNFSKTGGPTRTVTVSGSITLDDGANGGNVTISAGDAVAGSADYNLLGDWTNAGTFSTSGTVNFNGTLAQVMTGDNNFGSLILENTNGLTIDDDVTTTIADNLTVTSGTLNTGGGTATVVFDGAGEQSINGAVTFNNLTKQAGDTLSLSGTSSVNGTLTLTEGIINTTSSDLLVIGADGDIPSGSASSYINGPLQHTENSAVADTKLFPFGNNGIYRPITLNLTQADAVNRTYTGSLTEGAAPSRTLPTGADSLIRVSGFRYYTITQSNPAAVTAASVTIDYNVDDRSDDGPTLRVAKSDGAGNWVNIGGTGSASGIEAGDFVAGSITSGNFTTFSEFVLASSSEPLNPLPIELLSFSGEVAGEAVELAWVTAWEKNNDFFVVERSADGKNFTAIGEVAGSGDSQVELSYKFTDVQPLQGIAYYRLKQVDYDGNFDYSRLISLTYLREATFVAGVYPNPAERGQTVLSIEGAARNSTLQLRLVHASGKVVRILQLQSDESGIVKERITGLDQLASGVYTLLITGERVNEAIRLVLH